MRRKIWTENYKFWQSLLGVLLQVKLELEIWKLVNLEVKLEVKIDLLEVKYPSEAGAEQKLWKWP